MASPLRLTVNGNKSVCAKCVDKNMIFTYVVLHLYRKLRHTGREGGRERGRVGGREGQKEREQHERERGQKKYFKLSRRAKKMGLGFC